MWTGKHSPWLWLAIILDATIVVRRLSYEIASILSVLPYRSVTEWKTATDLLIGVVFHSACCFAIVMALNRDRGPLIFWNLCYLAVLVAVVVRFPLDITSLLIRFGTSVERSFIMVGLVVATIATCMAGRHMQ